MIFQSASPLVPSVPPVAPGPQVTDWITAIATVAAVIATLAAVIVALRLAGREERHRAKEEQRRALAQARLVRITVPDWSIGALPTGPGYRFAPKVVNAGDRPITDVKVDLWIGDLSGEPDLEDSVDFIAAGAEVTLLLEMGHPDATAEVALRVTWSDADGRNWFLDLHERDRFRAELFTGQPPRPWHLSVERRRNLRA
jgi:hypothetical protein